MIRIIYVFLGGGAGSVARYLTTLAAARLISPEFPFGTLIVNLVGCFLIGFIHSVAMLSARLSERSVVVRLRAQLPGGRRHSA